MNGPSKQIIWTDRNISVDAWTRLGKCNEVITTIKQVIQNNKEIIHKSSTSSDGWVATRIRC